MSLRGTRPRRQPRLDLGGGLLLRPWTPDDAPALLLGHRDALVRHYAIDLVDDPATALATIQVLGSAWHRREGAAWAVSDAAGTVLGSVRFVLRDADLGVGGVGYWLLPEARGRGVATTAVRSSTAAVFARLGWHRIELRHAVENDRSCAVARRAGYRQEGLLRAGMRYPDDGRWSDEHLHARLAGDPEPG